MGSPGLTVSNLVRADAAAPAHADETAHALRLLRLLITAVDHADGGRLALNADSALVSVIRRLLSSGEGPVHSTRTATMALRDLVWRVDTVRGLIVAGGPIDLEALADLLDTHDIHLFLRQEP